MNYFMGQGRLYAAPRSAGAVSGPYRNFGNISALSLSLGQGAARVADSGALRHSGTRPGFGATLESFYPDNLALLLGGSKSSNNATTNATASITVYRGQMTPLPDINLTAFTLKNAAGTVTYVSGKDYVINLRTGALDIPANSSIADASVVSATYSSSSYSTLKPFTQNPVEIALRYDGINTVDQSPVVIDIFRVRLDPVDALDLIGDNLATLKLSGVMLPDPVQHAAGNNFFRIRNV